jgi:hypothetical protein
LFNQNVASTVGAYVWAYRFISFSVQSSNLIPIQIFKGF